MKKPVRLDYQRPRNPNGTAIDTSSAAALYTKRTAALALAVFLEHISETHAYDGALVNVDVDLGVITLHDNWAPPYDWKWVTFGLTVAYLLLIHLIAFYFIGGRIWFRVRARFTVSRCDVATQCTRLPDFSVTTVDGLRSELRARGVRNTGLRADLEARLAAAIASSES
jgi:hypothetical protein